MNIQVKDNQSSLRENKFVLCLIKISALFASAKTMLPKLYIWYIKERGGGTIFRPGIFFGATSERDSVLRENNKKLWSPN